MNYARIGVACLAILGSDLLGNGLLINNEKLRIATAPVFAQSNDSKEVEAEKLIKQGEQQVQRSQFKEALASYQKALVIYRDLKDPEGENVALLGIGYTYYSLGQYQQAIAYHQQGLNIAKQNGKRDEEGSALTSLGDVYYALGQYPKAIELHQQALNIFKEIGDREGEADALTGLGDVYAGLGEYNKAIAYHLQALDIAKQTNNRNSEVDYLNNLGEVYFNMEQYSKAIEYHQQALAIARQIHNTNREGYALIGLGDTYIHLEQSQKAIDYLQQSLTIFRQTGDRSGEAYVLNNLGEAYYSLKQEAQALNYYQQALPLFKGTGDREGEGLIFTNLGELLEAQNQPELAIVFYKQAVNISEGIRQSLRGLDRKLQQSYIRTVSDSYRSLADLLLQQNRVIEALKVLDLLKEQELEDFFKNSRTHENGQSGIQLLSVEQQLLNTYEGFKDLEFRNHASVISFLQELKQIPTEKLNEIPTNLRRLPKDVVLFYPVVFEERLELVMFAPERAPIHYPVPVKKSELEKAIQSFRSGLAHQPLSVEDVNDVKKDGQKLYNWLIKPLAEDLESIKPRTIIYAPDGKLRYIPLTALFDGKQWLVEQYRVNNIVTYNLTSFEQKLLTQSRVLAGAFGGRADEKPFGFKGLPGSLKEVENIATTMPNTVKLLGNDFNLQSVATQFSGHNIVHFATHAQFVSGTPADSYILLGNGDKITLRQIKEWQMPNVDLVVLSACQTGLGNLKNGIEILGLGYQFQVAGAKATIASLWEVSDRSTQKLMNAFYDGLNKGMSKSEALHYAQITLIKQKQGEQNIDFSAPYYWSPFILIGNGQ